MLTIRKRGELYHVRGTVRVGNKTVKVPERSTGFRKSSDAKEYVSRLEKQIVDSFLRPEEAKNQTTTFDDCLKVYMNEKTVSIPNFITIKVLIRHFEGVPISEIPQKWSIFCAAKSDIKDGTLNRYASQLNAILNFAKDRLNITPQLIKRAPVNDAVVFLLPEGVKEKLLSCYSNKTRPIFITLAYQGFRVSECLHLLWEDIHLKERMIVIRTSKNGETRIVPMHPKVWWVMARKWIKAGKPITGAVFLTIYGKEYRDGRKLGGGGTLMKVQHTALQKLKERYGIDIKMRIHDWRHDWASRMVMAGVDLLTVQKLGGWKSLEMVKRYATFSSKHEIDAINKI